jgi:hypothetical protein
VQGPQGPAGPGTTELAYAIVQGDVGISATTAAGGNTIITAPAITVNGSTRICIECFFPRVFPAATNGRLTGAVVDGSTVIADNLFMLESPYGGAGVIRAAQLTKIFLTPAAGSHTYSIVGYQVNGNGSIGGLGAGATPGYIRITTA